MIIVTFLTCSCKRDFVFSLQNYKYYSKCMYRHIVLFKIREDILPETKEEVMNTFRQDILALKSVIPCLKDVMVSFNINTAEQWDICLRILPCIVGILLMWLLQGNSSLIFPEEHARTLKYDACFRKND